MAVNDISFEVADGEIFAFLGPNGAGKSTTIKMLTTLLEPSKGKMSINGFDPCHDKNDVRRSIGIVFQDPSLDEELTVMENMDFHGIVYKVAKEKRKKRTEELLKIVELWERRNDFVKDFSGGMKRRLEIARGLLHHPKVFFLDEPTLGLDPQTRNSIWQYIKNLNKKKNVTVFFTTHYMDEADRIADKIAIIDHGIIIAQGDSAHLKTITGATSLEEAFLSLTGKEIREEGASNIDNMRMRKKMNRK